MNHGFSGLIVLIIVGMVAAAGAGVASVVIVNRPNSTPATTQPPSSTSNNNPQLSPAPLEVSKFNPFLPSESKITTYQRSIIGKTTDDELVKMVGLKTKRTLPNGDVQFIFESPIGVENSVITNDGKAIYEQVVTVNPQTLIHPKLSEFVAKYGPAESVLIGSKYFGPVEKVTIWGSLGVAILSNLNTSEVDQIQTFLPLKTDEYISRWGQDYQASNGKIEDTF